jgi:hypothetical protein
MPDSEQPASELLRDAAALLVQSLPGADFRQVAADVLMLLAFRGFPDRRRGDIASYAGDAVERSGQERNRGELTRVVEAAIRAALGETAAADGLGRVKLANAQLLLMRDLVLARSMTPDEVDELIAHAEVYRQRQPVHPTRWPGWLRLRNRRATRPAPYDDATSHGPGSLAGRRLRAIMMGDREELARVPDDPRVNDTLGVLDALFELVTQRRFGADYEVRDVAQFVQQVAQRTPHGLPAPFIGTEAIVRSQLGEPVPVDDIDRNTVAGVKALVSRAAVPELALFDRELDELLAEAERLASERGFRPTPAPPPDSVASSA